MKSYVFYICIILKNHPIRIIHELNFIVLFILESLVNIRASIPIQLNALHHMLVQYDALETGQKEINDWLNSCDEFLSTLKLSKNREELYSDIDYLKVCF
jgi:hypothetical protein